MTTVISRAQKSDSLSLSLFLIEVDRNIIHQMTPKFQIFRPTDEKIVKNLAIFC